MTKELRNEIISWIVWIAVAIFAALLINNFVIVNASVPSGSMKNTIQEKSRIVAFRLNYLFSEPERFDVVVFVFPDDDKTLFVKRIVGLPGETVEVREGKIYINGSNTPLRDDFIRTDEGYGPDFPPTVIPEDCYFMMGDNRGGSHDSRGWNDSFVKKSKILGKVYFSYWPKLKLIK